MYLKLFWIAFLSTLPLIESRLAIPFGILKYNLHPGLVLTIGVFFNTMAVAIALKLLPFFEKFLRKKYKFCDKFLEDLFQKTHASHRESIKIWGNIFLFVFVAIPLPGSGGWTAALVAYVFGFPFWRSMFLITLGLLAAAGIVVLITLGGLEIFTESLF